jgi:hypothetical protein
VTCPIVLLYVTSVGFRTALIHYYVDIVSRVLAGRPAGRTDASAPLSAGAASPPPPVGMGGENLLHLGSPVKETVQ